jgi:hypothetical protein
MLAAAPVSVRICPDGRSKTTITVNGRACDVNVPLSTHAALSMLEDVHYDPGVRPHTVPDTCPQVIFKEGNFLPNGAKRTREKMTGRCRNSVNSSTPKQPNPNKWHMSGGAKGRIDFDTNDPNIKLRRTYGSLVRKDAGLARATNWRFHMYCVSRRKANGDFELDGNVKLYHIMEKERRNEVLAVGCEIASSVPPQPKAVIAQARVDDQTQPQCDAGPAMASRAGGTAAFPESKLIAASPVIASVVGQVAVENADEDCTPPEPHAVIDQAWVDEQKQPQCDGFATAEDTGARHPAWRIAAASHVGCAAPLLESVVQLIPDTDGTVSEVVVGQGEHNAEDQWSIGSGYSSDNCSSSDERDTSLVWQSSFNHLSDIPSNGNSWDSRANEITTSRDDAGVYWDAYFSDSDASDDSIDTQVVYQETNAYDYFSDSDASDDSIDTQVGYQETNAYDFINLVVLPTEPGDAADIVGSKSPCCPYCHNTAEHIEKRCGCLVCTMAGSILVKEFRSE